MSRIRLAVAVAAFAGAIGTGTAGATSVVCVNEPATDPVYRGCTYIDTTQPCVYGGGRILNRPYMIICP